MLRVLILIGCIHLMADDDECAICLDRVPNVVLHCGHEFCSTCLYETFRSRIENRCSVCRADCAQELSNIRSDYYRLNRAILSDSTSALSSLLHRGVLSSVINIQDELGATPLHIAAEGGHWRVAMFLIRHGAELGIRNLAGYTPLHSAVLSRDITTLFVMINLGGRVVYDLDHESPLVLAVRTHLPAAIPPLLEASEATEIDPEMLEILIDQGEDIDPAVLFHLFSSELYAPQALVAADGRMQIRLFEIVVTALDGGHFDLVNTIFTRYMSATWFEQAVASGRYDVALLMIRARIDLLQMGADGSRLLNNLLALRGNVEVDRMLSEALILYAAEGNAAAIQTFLELGVPVASRGLGGITALHAAAVSGYAAVIRTLVCQRVDLNLVDAQGETALHYAVTGDQDALVLMLLELGIDATIHNAAGQTAADIAREQGNAALAILIETFRVRAMGIVPLPSPRGRRLPAISPIHARRHDFRG